MASVKYGVIITDIKGSVGGTTFKGSKSGPVIQNKITKADAVRAGRIQNQDGSPRNALPNLNLSRNASAWRSLDPADRAAWVSAAPDFEFTNRYGDPYTPSGFQLYMSQNNTLLNIAEPAISTPAAAASIEPTPEFEQASVGSNVIGISMPAGIPAGYTLQIYLSGPISPGRNFEPGLLKLVDLKTGGGTTFGLDAKYVSVFGTIPATGQIFCGSKITKADAARSSLLTWIPISW